MKRRLEIVIVMQTFAVWWTRITSITSIQIIIHSEDVTQNVTVFGQLAQSMSVNLDGWTTLLQKSQPLN